MERPPNGKVRFAYDVLSLLHDVLSGVVAAIVTVLIQSALKHKKAVRAIGTVALFSGFLYVLNVVGIIVAPVFLSLTSDNPWAVPYINYPLTMVNFEEAGLGTMAIGLYLVLSMRFSIRKISEDSLYLY